MESAAMTVLFLVLAPLRETFIYGALWWEWVSMLIVHLPLLIMEGIAIVAFIRHYNSRLKYRDIVPMAKEERLLHTLYILFPLSLAATHMCTIAAASWWFLLPASMPTFCAYIFLMTHGVVCLTGDSGK